MECHEHSVQCELVILELIFKFVTIFTEAMNDAQFVIANESYTKCTQ